MKYTSSHILSVPISGRYGLRLLREGVPDLVAISKVIDMTSGDE